MEQEFLDNSPGISPTSPGRSELMSNSTAAFFERMETITASRDQFLLSASGELQKHLEAHQPAIQYSKRATKRTESPSRVDSSDHESVTCRSPDLGPPQPMHITQSCFSNRLEDLYDQLYSKLQFMQVNKCLELAIFCHIYHEPRPTIPILAFTGKHGGSMRGRCASPVPRRLTPPPLLPRRLAPRPTLQRRPRRRPSNAASPAGTRPPTHPLPRGRRV
jgi:hypothetical protein